jgi:hypothetical protein
MEEDPEGFQAGDTNLRRYVGNDPTNKVDPTGLADEPAEALAKLGDRIQVVDILRRYPEQLQKNDYDRISKRWEILRKMPRVSDEIDEVESKRLGRKVNKVIFPTEDDAREYEAIIALYNQMHKDGRGQDGSVMVPRDLYSPDKHMPRSSKTSKRCS